MIRSYEKEVSWKAGGLAISVHVALLGALLISFNWKAAHPVLNITEVELWDNIPNNSAQQPLPVEKIEPQPEPIVKEEPKPEPIVKEVPKEELAVDIALEKKKKELAQKKQLDTLKEEARKDDMHAQIKAAQSKNQNDALKKLQQEALADEKIAGDQQVLSAKAAANAGVVDVFRNKIQAKIRGNVNKSLCGAGNPELKFEIGLLPTGELSDNPSLVKSSEITACDEAVERAIIASQPLPLPSDATLFSQFRNLKLTFKPND